MFIRLRVKNFQSHEKLEITFDPKITTIVGPTDVGKSAIIRALRWICLNRPRGDFFIKWGEKKVWASLLTDEGKISRDRSPSTNTYTAGKTELKAIGSDVPEQVFNILNVSDLNFQNQLDAAFWIAESAGEVSRQLNQIVDLSIVDRTLSNIQKHKNRVSSSIEVHKENRDKAKDELEKLKHVDDMEEGLKELKTTWERLDKAAGDWFLLENKIQDLQQIQKDLDNCPDPVDEIEETARTLFDTIYQIKNLEYAIEGINEIKIEPVPDTKKLSTLETNCKRLKETETNIEELTEYIDKIETLNEEMQNLEWDAKRTTERLSEYKTCPLCQKKL